MAIVETELVFWAGLLVRRPALGIGKFGNGGAMNRFKMMKAAIAMIPMNREIAATGAERFGSGKSAILRDDAKFSGGRQSPPVRNVRAIQFFRNERF